MGRAQTPEHSGADRNQAEAQLAHPARSTTVACGTFLSSVVSDFQSHCQQMLVQVSSTDTLCQDVCCIFAPGTLVNWLTRLEASAAWIQRHPASK